VIQFAEVEVVKLQHSLLKVLPRIFVHDSPWMASTARMLALELWRDNVRAVDVEGQR
jgi:hypothetical protein